MSRGRKPSNIITSISWDDIFWKNLPTYINILNSYLNSVGFELVEVYNLLDKLPFKLPKGLNSKEINSKGMYPVISQSKEFIIGFNDNSELLVKDCFPLIVFGDHSKTIKYVEKPFIIGADGVKILKPIKSFNEKFFYYFLHGVITDTKDYGRHFSLLRKGVIANVTDVDLQNSIVNFLDDLSIGIIDNDKFYFNNEIERKIYNLQTNQLKQIEISSELTHQLDLIKQLRQAFLREAMQGSLTPTLSKEEGAETGHDLLAKIKAEKAQLIAEKKLKKEKELPPITVDEIPFEIPEHWAWCRLGELAYITSGSTPSKDAFVETGIPYLKMYNLRNQKIDFFYNPQYIKEEVHNGQLKRCRAYPGDVIMNIVGPPLGKIAIIPESLPECNFNQAAVLIRPMIKNMNQFIFWFLNEMSEIDAIETKGVAGQANISVTQAHNMKIPLPPLHEQEQIVAKLEELMAYCDGLEQSIAASQGYNEKLLQQVLREALQGEEV